MVFQARWAEKVELVLQVIQVKPVHVVSQENALPVVQVKPAQTVVEVPQVTMVLAVFQV